MSANDKSQMHALAQAVRAAAHPVPDRHGANFYATDPELQCQLYLPADLLAHLQPYLQRMGELAGGRIDELAGIADGIRPRSSTAAAPARTASASSSIQPMKSLSASPTRAGTAAMTLVASSESPRTPAWNRLFVIFIYAFVLKIQCLESSRRS